MDLKKPLSLDGQVDRLISHGMDIRDVDRAKQVLSEINYYRFSGFALQFRDGQRPDDYVPGTKFEDVHMLHDFDAGLRCMLKPCLDIVELFARSQIAHGFSLAKCRKPPYEQHYDPANFHNGTVHGSIIVSSLDREKKHCKDATFVTHHDRKYDGKMPLWVIVELLSFTNMSKLYSAMYFSEQSIIASAMGTSRETLKNHLHCLANLRNKVAHSGRLYNVTYSPPVMLGRNYLHANPDISANTLFAYLIVLLRRLPNDAHKAAFADKVADVFSKRPDCVDLRLLGFPDDYMARLYREIG